MKILHEFKQKVSVGEETKEYTIRLKQLSRRDKEDISVVYNAEYGKALSKGLAPHMTLRKNAIDSGGLLAKQEVERAEEVYRAVFAKGNELQLAVAEKRQEDEISKIQQEIDDLWKEYQNYERPSAELYSRSAEFEAEKNCVTWAVLNFTYVLNGEREEELFPGSIADSRFNYYCECVDNNKELEKIVFDKSYGCYFQAIKSPETATKEFFEALTDE